MDDMTAPSAHVRHNLEGLTAVFPASYLLSYILPHADQRMSGASLMGAGIEIGAAPESSAQAFTIAAVGGSALRMR